MALLIFLAIILLVVFILAGGYFLNQYVERMYLYKIFGFWKICVLSMLVICFYVGLVASTHDWYKPAYKEYESYMLSVLHLGYNGYLHDYDNRHWSRPANVDSILTLPFVVGGKILDKKERILTEQEFINKNILAYQKEYDKYPPNKSKYDLDHVIYVTLTLIIFLGSLVSYLIYNAHKTSFFMAIPIFFYQLLAAHSLIIIVIWIASLISDMQRKLHEPSGGYR